jgi:hypothetical protein
LRGDTLLPQKFVAEGRGLLGHLIHLHVFIHNLN